jgi:hypothetical protein
MPGTMTVPQDGRRQVPAGAAMTTINGRPATGAEELVILLDWYCGYLAAWLHGHRYKLSVQYWLGRWAGSR